MTSFKKSDSKTVRSEAWLVPSSKRVAAVTTGLLVVAAFLAVGCSKSKELSHVSNNNSSQVTSSPVPVGASVATTPAIPAEKQVSKKVAKKRPSTVTYKDVASGVSFQYPRKYALKTGDEAKLEWNGLGPVPMNFIEPGGVTVAAVELPRGSYPGTDFASAFFNVSLNRSLSAEQCGKFGLTDMVHPDEPADPTKVKIGGKEFDQVEDFGGEAIKQADAKYYHLYENDACYEFALGLGTAGYGIEEGVEPVDRAEVFKKLEKILATVQLQPVAEKDVTVAKTESPVNKEATTTANSGTTPDSSSEKPAESTPQSTATKVDNPRQDMVGGEIPQTNEKIQK
jgi:hypothetical protein